MDTGSSTMVMRKTILACSAMAAVTLSGSAHAGAQSQAIGLWIDHTGKGGIRIEQCGEKLCGKIVWLRDTLNAEGKPMMDRYNPDAVKQKRPLCGVQVLGELAPVAGNGFDGGWIYDPKEGKSYSAAIEVAGPTQLRVTGYLGFKLMGQTFVWTRASGDLQKCDVQPKEVSAPAGAVPAASTPVVKAASPAPSAVKAVSAIPPAGSAAKPAPPKALAVDEAQIVKRATASPSPSVAVAKPNTVVTSSTAKGREIPVNADKTPVKPIAVTGAKPAVQKQALTKINSPKSIKPVIAQKEVLPWTKTPAAAAAIAKPAKAVTPAKPAKATPSAVNASVKSTDAVPSKNVAKQAASKSLAVKKTAEPAASEQTDEATFSGNGETGSYPIQLPPAAATLN